MDEFMKAALDEARKGLREGGVPIGSVLAVGGRILGRGRNRRVQEDSVSLYRKSTLYSTLSPCDMCSGAILLYGIPKVVVGENVNFKGPEEYLKGRGVEVVVLNEAECIRLMKEFIEKNPRLWNEDIGR
jgi:cytosine deaminase